jgi:hypothetical protein
VSNDLVAKTNPVERDMSRVYQRNHIIHPRLPHGNITPRPSDNDGIGGHWFGYHRPKPVLEAFIGMGRPKEYFLGREVLDNLSNTLAPKGLSFG